MEALLVIYLFFLGKNKGKILKEMKLWDNLQIIRIKNSSGSSKGDKQQIPIKLEKFLYDLLSVS